MEKFIIEGQTPLKGKIAISGSKNAALPLMAAALLADGDVQLNNIPFLQDIYTFINVWFQNMYELVSIFVFSIY